MDVRSFSEVRSFIEMRSLVATRSKMGGVPFDPGCERCCCVWDKTEYSAHAALLDWIGVDWLRRRVLRRRRASIWMTAAAVSARISWSRRARRCRSHFSKRTESKLPTTVAVQAHSQYKWLRTIVSDGLTPVKTIRLSVSFQTTITLVAAAFENSCQTDSMLSSMCWNTGPFSRCTPCVSGRTTVTRRADVMVSSHACPRLSTMQSGAAPLYGGGWQSQWEFSARISANSCENALPNAQPASMPVMLGMVSIPGIQLDFCEMCLRVPAGMRTKRA
mmetsp:Transcript_25146/g.62324  ORF Transcript_25146/g.62324 Transcript_25146/m.62324 type:complete len:275 (-) Transcript_25146:296-1120(-)